MKHELNVPHAWAHSTENVPFLNWL